LSFLRKRQLQGGRYGGWPLEDLYADSYLLHGLIYNYMVKVPTLTVDEMRSGVRTIVPYDEACRERAKHNLVHRVEMFRLH
jgi:hypothetical protein